METVFTKIINGVIPAVKIYEDADTYAFLDHNPVTRGHILVISKLPIDHLDDCPEDVYQAIFRTVQRMSKLLKTKLHPERVGIVVHGYEIPHAHVHVIPIYHQGDLKFPTRPDTFPGDKALQDIADELVGASV